MLAGIPDVNNGYGPQATTSSDISNSNNVSKKEATPVSESSSGGTTVLPSAPPKDDKILTPEELKQIIMGNDGIRVTASDFEEHVLQQKEAENGWTLLTEDKQQNYPPKTNDVGANSSTSANTNSTGAIPKTFVSTNVSENNADSSAEEKRHPSSSGSNSSTSNGKDEEQLLGNFKFLFLILVHLFDVSLLL